MREIILAVALALAIPLGACSTLPGKIASAVTVGVDNPVSIQELATVEASYGAVLSAAVTYRRLCVAGQTNIVGTNCRAIVMKMQDANRLAHAQILVARDFVKKKKVNASVALATARQAITAFQAATPSVGAQ